MSVTIDTASAGLEELGRAWVEAERDGDPEAQAALLEAAEAMDREAARRARSAQRHVHGDWAEWYEAAVAQCTHAERDCRGRMFSQAAKDAHITEEIGLWEGPEEWAQRMASEELCLWWQGHGGRLTYGVWRARNAAAKRAAERDWRETQAETCPKGPGVRREQWATETPEERDARWAAELQECARHARPGTQEGGDMTAGVVGPALAKAGAHIAGQVVGRTAGFVAQQAAYGVMRGGVRGGVTSTPAGDAATWGKPADPGESAERLARRAGANAALDVIERSRERQAGGGLVVAGEDTLARYRPPVPDAEPIDGCGLMDIVLAYIKEHMWFRHEWQYTLLAAWVLHAVARDGQADGTRGDLIWEVSPRLIFTSREPGGGKSTALMLCAVLTAARIRRLVPVTAAAYAKLMASHKQVACLDEVQAVFGSGKAQRILRAEINDGYIPGGASMTASGHRPSWGPCAMSALDKLLYETGEEMDDTFGRSFLVRVECAPYRPRPLDSRFIALGEEIAAELSAYAAQERAAFKRNEFGLLDAAAEGAHAGIGGGGKQAHRAPQIAGPLLAIGVTLGGHWERDIWEAVYQASGSTVTAAKQSGVSGLLNRMAAAGYDVPAPGTSEEEWAQ